MERTFFDTNVLLYADDVSGGCSRLWSEDLQHGRVFDGVRIENPFAGQP
jgi:predicted nucleic acid-binding protein